MPFSIKEIEKIANPDNHKIVYDNYDYWWFSNKCNHWELHCVKPFKSYLIAIQHVKYWVPQYNEMLAKRELSFDRIINDIKNDVRIYDIKNSNIKTIDKVISILDIKPYLNQTEISEILGTSKMAISKHLKKLKYA